MCGEPALRIAERVRTGAASAVEVVREHLSRTRSLNDRVGAFELIRDEAALAEAVQLERRPDLNQLPLAGVPVGIKDNVPVAGEPMRCGSTATSVAPSNSSHIVVERMRRAGAIVLGLTRVPELSVWATTDNAFGIARNPWNLELTPGGSSGGSAAAVAAGMVPIAHGNDGMGSIRIPAACCGLFGLKPGNGYVPSRLGVHSWFGMAENGPLTTTVTDAAILLAVMAGRTVPDTVEPPAAPLRIALSLRSPLPGAPMDPEYRAAVEWAGQLLSDSRHHTEFAEPPYAIRNTMPLLARWFAGVAADAELLDESALEPRTRRHMKMGRLAARTRLIRQADVAWWYRRAAAFFDRHDILVTPALASTPLPASAWSRRSWIANVSSNVMYAPFAALWNLAGFPAAVVPAGMHSTGVPLSVQLVAAPGGEPLLLSLARQIEMLKPWQRQAPIEDQANSGF